MSFSAIWARMVILWLPLLKIHLQMNQPLSCISYHQYQGHEVAPPKFIIVSIVPPPRFKVVAWLFFRICTQKLIHYTKNETEQWTVPCKSTWWSNRCMGVSYENIKNHQVGNFQTSTSAEEPSPPPDMESHLKSTTPSLMPWYPHQDHMQQRKSCADGGVGQARKWVAKNQVRIRCHSFLLWGDSNRCDTVRFWYK